MPAPNCDVLFVGCEGVGKTLLLKRLHLFTKPPAEQEPLIAQTVSTVGVEMKELNTGKKNKLKLREIGGSMVSVWQNYYDDSKNIVFVIDAANSPQVSSSCLELLQMCQHPKVQGKSILVVINKIDIESAMTEQTINHLIPLQDLVSTMNPPLEVVSVSALDGRNIGALYKWLERTVK